MKTAIRIARLELSTLFYSPIAWFLLIVFLFQCGLSYTEKIDNYLTLQQLGSPKDLLIYATNTIFGLPGGLPNGVLSEIISRLYLYLPLLTMGLMSREISSGTIKLLYSSPVKINQIIFGKFLSMIVYNFLLILILGVFVIMGCFHIAHADVGQLFSGLLGIYLLLCAYAAIGLFMSCLTSYQVVAALSTFVLFALLSYIGSLWQNIDYARDVTYALSISGRTTHMIAGLISSKDVIYFLVVIYIFLGLSMLRLQSERQSRPILSHILRYSLLIGSAVLISYGSSRPGLIAYYDATANKTETLTPNTQQIIKEIGNSPLEVISYINILDQRFFYGLPSRRNLDQDRWEPYLRFKPDIRFKYVYYYDSIPDPEIYKRNSGKTLKQIAQDYAQMHKVDFRDFKGPEEVGKMADLKPEQNRYVMQLRFKGKSTFLRLFDDQRAFPSEAETSAALKRMTSKLPKIVFLQGEQERSANKFDTGSYKTLTSDITFRYALVNQGFDVQTISLKNQEIPADITALVIADPKTPFEPAILAKLQHYIAAGGNVMINGEPGRQQILEPLLKMLGVSFTDGIIAQPTRDLPPELALTYITPVAAKFSKLSAEDMAGGLRVAMPGATGLTYTPNGNYKVEPLLYTDAVNSWQKKGIITLDSARAKFAPEQGDVKMKVPVALGLTRMINGRQQRVIVTGDADFLSVFNMRKEHLDIANYHFNISMFGWLDYGKFPIDTTLPVSKDDHVLINSGGIILVKYIFLGLIPAILLITCALILLRRKKK